MRLIDADALKDYIRGACEDMKHLYKDNGAWAKEITESFCKDIDEQPTVSAEPHWIPVTEDTLPEENRVVVVCGDKGTWDFGTYRGHGDNIHFWHWKKNTYKRVYWWMYKEDALPEPYKGVTNDRF